MDAGGWCLLSRMGGVRVQTYDISNSYTPFAVDHFDRELIARMRQGKDELRTAAQTSKLLMWESERLLAITDSLCRLTLLD